MVRSTVESGSQEQPALKRPHFARCATCGRYLAPEARVDGRHCSPECAAKFLRCTTCGRYYPAAGGYSEEHCSRECATRYSLQRTYGPAQIDIRMEDLV
jgi:hypothetical protein